MKVLKGYRFRIYPDEKQKKLLKQTFGCVRFTYNHLLMARKEMHHSEGGGKLTPASLKTIYPFLKETDSLALANAQRNLDRAFTNFFQGRAGYPKLKSKNNSWQSYTTNNQKNTICLHEGKLKLPKLKSLIPVDTHRQVKGTIKSATISAKNFEAFYVSLLCLEEIVEMPKTAKSVGIIFCPETLVSLSKTVVNLPVLCEEKKEERLFREQKKLKLRAKLAKKRHIPLEEAKNYQKQKQRVIKLFNEKSYRKSNYIDQLTYLLVHQFDHIFIEHHPEIEENGRFTQSDWYGFIQKIHYKCEWYGKYFHLTDVPTTSLNRAELIEDVGLRSLQ